nr:hypothetical protein [Tanacetum cinerariifolium]
MPPRKAPKTRSTRASPSTTIATIIPMIDDQLKAQIGQGVANVLAERDATRSRNGKDSHDLGTGRRRTKRTICECTYHDFMKCEPLEFKGTEGVVELSQWFERMESGFHISHCTSDKIKKYVGGLPDMIHESVMASRPKEMQKAIEIATEIMDKKINTFAEHQAENKRKFDDTSKNNQNQQQSFKRQNVAQAYTARLGEKKPYGGSKPLCTKCNYHHDRQCAPKCHKCNRFGHLARDYRSPTATNNQRNLTFYQCGNQGHYRSDCLI